MLKKFIRLLDELLPCDPSYSSVGLSVGQLVVQSVGRSSVGRLVGPWLVGLS